MAILSDVPGDLEKSGRESVLLPPKSPISMHTWNGFTGPQEECLARMIFFGESSLRKAIHQFLAHYHTERNHQGLGNRILEPGEKLG